MGFRIPFSLSFLLMFTSIKINKITLNYGQGGGRTKRQEILFLSYRAKKEMDHVRCAERQNTTLWHQLYEAGIALIVIVGSWFEMPKFLSKCRL